MRSQNTPICGPVFQTKAEELAMEDDFKCSTGGLSRFKARLNIVIGESAVVDKYIHRH